MRTRRSIVVVLATVVVGATCAITGQPAGALIPPWQAHPPGEARALTCTSEVVATSPGGPSDSDLSSDGRWVVYTSSADPTGDNPDGNREVFRHDRDTDTTVQVTDLPDGDAARPSVSDDGESVAYLYVDQPLAVPHLATVTGGGDIAVGGVSNDGIDDIEISDDGSVVVYDSSANDDGQNADGNREVWRFATGTLATTNLTQTAPGTTSTDPSVDGDGDRIAFTSDGELDPTVTQDVVARDEVFLFEGTPGEARQLSQDPDGAAWGAHVDDAGERVLFTAPYAAGTSAWLADVAAEIVQSASRGPLKDELYEAEAISGDGRYGFMSGLRIRLDTLAIAGAVGDGAVDDTGHVTTASSSAGLSVWTCPSFVDVSFAHPFSDDVEWLSTEQISTGNLDGSYRPATSVSRAAMAAFLYRLAGSPTFDPPGVASFSDVSTSHPFFAEVEWLVEQGITEGFSDDTYRPSSAVTRQAMSAFIYRTVGSPVYVPPPTASFADVSTAHPFFAEIEWMNSEAITTGYPDDTFRPAADVTRQAMAAFLHRAHPLLPT
jgi:Tol biopolymer transport system component